MSFTVIEQAKARLHRSELAVPGSNPAMFEKAARSAADIIFLDCEVFSENFIDAAGLENLRTEAQFPFYSF